MFVSLDVDKFRPGRLTLWARRESFLRSVCLSIPENTLVLLPPPRFAGGKIITSYLFGCAYPLSSRYPARISFKIPKAAPSKNLGIPAIISYS